MSHRYKRRYTLKWPKKAAVKKIKREIREKLGTRSILKLSLEEVVILLNPTLRGWMNYFKYGNSSKVFNQIDSYVHMNDLRFGGVRNIKGVVEDGKQIFRGRNTETLGC